MVRASIDLARLRQSALTNSNAERHSTEKTQLDDKQCAKASKGIPWSHLLRNGCGKEGLSEASPDSCHETKASTQAQFNQAQSNG